VNFAGYFYLPVCNWKISCKFAGKLKLIDMEAIIQNYNLSVPSSDVNFFKTLSSKMGWTFTKVKTKEKHSPLYYELDHAFKDVKLMIEGKKKGKSAYDLLYELRDNSNS
jgi:hypothetical protein